ncbi:protoheme IX farnesyltransferase, partial [Vibrio sp. M60_M31a]
IYLFTSLLLNAGFIYHAWKLKFAPEERSAIETFKFSIYHLFVLFIALLADHNLNLSMM